MKLLIYGSMDFANTVSALATDCGHDVIGLIDDFNTGPGIIGNFESTRLSHPPETHGVAVAIGYKNLHARQTICARVHASGYQTPSLIHPRAYVANSASIGHGCMIMAGAIIDVRARIGNFVVAWPAVCINHDVVIGENTFLSPSTTVCGHSQIGRNTFIGAGSTISDHCEVPPSSFLKLQTRFTGTTQ
ncbi:hypothetical protein [Thauera sp. WH-1]|uniref:PglD-related sugar-binding protein n=1 Tax=Thauera sp. WH-1 TaxID=3398230 RepID=UPI0039FC877B